MDASIVSQVPLMPKAPSMGTSSGQGAILLPKRQPDAALKAEIRQAEADVAQLERRRYQAVQRAAQAIANIYVVSDQRFTIYKDTTGQYITRFTSLRDGRVTYIPEPDLLMMARRSGAESQAISINV